jgi:hypothetical protein
MAATPFAEIQSETTPAILRKSDPLVRPAPRSPLRPPSARSDAVADKAGVEFIAEITAALASG